MSPRNVPKTPWTVVNDATQSFECKRCGEVVPFHLPCALRTFSELCKGFARAHRDCQVPAPRKDPAETSQETSTPGSDTPGASSEVPKSGKPSPEASP